MIGNKQIYNIVKFIWILTISLTMSGCVSGYKSENIGYPIEDIQKVVSESLPAEVAYVSPNGHEILSKIFKGNGGALSLMMKVTILGDRRPYDLSFEVNRVSDKIKDPMDAFDSGERFTGEESLSKRIATKIQDELAKRHKNRNMFDDFKPF